MSCFWKLVRPSLADESNRNTMSVGLFAHPEHRSRDTYLAFIYILNNKDYVDFTIIYVRCKYVLTKLILLYLL